ncbi:PqqD family protein [Paenarthrobacter sp. NPDC089675]|uniref:PqqD family protein n=1 Tax=Paenarthrobacter sp. NPDC089675 TaxID=3364376 RepID=UPI0037F81310
MTKETGATTVEQFWHRAQAVAVVPSQSEMRVALLNLEQGSPLVLLGSAVLIWDLIDGTRTESDLLRELNAAFPGVGESAMEGHVRSFLAELSHHGLAVLSAWAAPKPSDTEISSP